MGISREEGLEEKLYLIWGEDYFKNILGLLRIKLPILMILRYGVKLLIMRRKIH